MKTAIGIAQWLLDETGSAYMENDFDRFINCFDLPHRIETATCKQTVKTVDEFRTLFENVSQSYQVMQTTALVRICDIAEFRTPKRIEATHITHIMSGNRRVVPPYPCFSVLTLREGRWRVASSQYDVDLSTHIGRAFDKPVQQQTHQ